MKSNWQPVVVVAAAIGALFAFGAYVNSRVQGYATGSYQYRVTARFLDADSGKPIEGVAIHPHPYASADGDWAVRPVTWIDNLDEWYEVASDPMFGAVSDADGAFELVFDETWCVGLREASPPVLQKDVGVFVIGKPGYELVEVPWTRGTTVVENTDEKGEPDASIDLGVVRLTRAKPR